VKGKKIAEGEKEKEQRRDSRERKRIYDQ